MRTDLHTHSSMSDGTDSPTVLILKARQTGLERVALTDHDTLDGVAEAQEAGRRVGVDVLVGMEMSAHLGDSEVHVLGYGMDPTDSGLGAELARIRASRVERLAGMVKLLNQAGARISVADVRARAVGASSIGRPHVADALVQAGYAIDRDDAFAKYLDVSGPAFVPRYTTELGEAIDLIHAAHGVAVLAHPWSRGGERVLTGEALAELVAHHGLEGIETDNPDHTPDQRDLLFQTGARLGLVRTGGSDYHGKGKTGHDLGSLTTRDSAYSELLRLIETRGGDRGLDLGSHGPRGQRR
mgnify:CR=1 FL=1